MVWKNWPIIRNSGLDWPVLRLLVLDHDDNPEIHHSVLSNLAVESGDSIRFPARMSKKITRSAAGDPPVSPGHTACTQLSGRLRAK